MVETAAGAPAAAPATTTDEHRTPGAAGGSPPDRRPASSIGRRPVGGRIARAWGRVLGWPSWVQVLVAYGASRLLAGVVIELAARWFQNPAGVGVLDPHYLDMVQIWDGRWYRDIAENGYPTTLPRSADGVDYNAWAFFPVFPALVRLVMTTGMAFSVSAVVLNFFAGAVAALLLHRLLLAGGQGNTRLAFVGVCVWLLLPPSPVLQVAYSEALAAALLAAALLLIVRRRYLWAAPTVLVLGLTRAVTAALLVVLVWHAVERYRRRDVDPLRRQQVLSMIVLGAAMAASVVLWPLIVGRQTETLLAFFQTQAAWGQQPGEGPFLPWLTWAYNGAGVTGVVALIFVAAVGIWLLAGRWTGWLPQDVRVFGISYPVYLLAVVSPITSMWRFLFLDFPVAGALAVLVAGGRPTGGRRWSSWRLSAAAALALVGLSWWVSVYLTRVPWADTPP